MSIEILTSTILSKMSNVGKWQARFFIDLTNLWLGLKGRYHFENLSRQGEMSSESYRANFSKPFDFKLFNLELFKYLGKEKVWVLDPTFLNKSGKKTPGIGYFCGAARAVGLSAKSKSRYRINRSCHCRYTESYILSLSCTSNDFVHRARLIGLLC